MWKFISNLDLLSLRRFHQLCFHNCHMSGENRNRKLIRISEMKIFFHQIKNQSLVHLDICFCIHYMYKSIRICFYWEDFTRFVFTFFVTIVASLRNSTAFSAKIRRKIGTGSRYGNLKWSLKNALFNNWKDLFLIIHKFNFIERIFSALFSHFLSELSHLWGLPLHSGGKKEPDIKNEDFFNQILSLMTYLVLSLDIYFCIHT